MKILFIQPPPRQIVREDIVVPPLQTRLKWVDYAKGIGIVLVVYGHMIGGALGGTLRIPDLMHQIYRIIYHFHMPLFFFLSGLFVHQSFEKRGMSKFITYKINTILYPYFIWSVIQGVGVLVVSTRVKLNAAVSFSDLLSIPYNPVQHLWFLYVLFLMFLIYSFFARYKYSILLFILLSVFLFFFPIETTNYALSKLCSNFIFFVLGIICCRYSIDSFISKKLSLFTMGMTIMVFVFFEFTASAILTKSLLLFNAIAGIAMTCFIAKYISGSGFFKIIGFIGLYTMPIYLAQGIGSFARVTLHSFWGIHNVAVIISVSALAGIIMPIIFYILTDRLNFHYFFFARK